MKLSQARNIGRKRIKMRKKSKKGPEAVIQRDIISAVKLHRCNIYRENVGMAQTKSGNKIRFGIRGFPDLFGFKWDNGKMFFIEVKAPKGRIRPDQIAFHQELMHRHAIHGIARSVDDALKIIDEELVGYGYPADSNPVI